MTLANPPEIFSSEFWTALPSTIAAVGSIIATILAYWKSKQQRHAARVETNEKLEEIHQSTNGTLEAAMKRIDDLENLIKELRKTKGA